MKKLSHYLYTGFLLSLLIGQTGIASGQAAHAIVDRSSNAPLERGTATAPCKTVNCGITYSKRGGTLHIEKGKYPEIMSLNKPVQLLAENGLVSIGEGANPQAKDFGLILEKMVQYAPEVRLHPADPYHPSAVQRFLNNSRMRRHRSGIGPIGWPDVQILDKGLVNISSLINQSSGGQHSGRGNNTTNFFLEIDGNEDHVRKGNIFTAPCFVHYRKAPNGVDNDLQYWFFYPYSGDIALLDEGPDINIAHEGDWEHITVRLDESWQHIKVIFYSAHEKIFKVFKELPFNFHFRLNASGHPIVYSAKHSHASYPIAGEIKRTWANDHTAEGGPIWKTWENLILLGSKEKPLNGQLWLKYTGRWGEIGHFDFTSGPYGPAFQPSWKNDDLNP